MLLNSKHFPFLNCHDLFLVFLLFLIFLMFLICLILMSILIVMICVHCSICKIGSLGLTARFPVQHHSLEASTSTKISIVQC